MTILGEALRIAVEDRGLDLGFLFLAQRCVLACWGCYTEAPWVGQYKQADIHLHLVLEDGGKAPFFQGLSSWVANCHLPKIFYAAYISGISVCPNFYTDFCLLVCLVVCWFVFETGPWCSPHWPWTHSHMAQLSLFLERFFFPLMCMDVHAVFEETRRGHQIPWTWSYKQL